MTKNKKKIGVTFDNIFVECCKDPATKNMSIEQITNQLKETIRAQIKAGYLRYKNGYYYEVNKRKVLFESKY